MDDAFDLSLAESAYLALLDAQQGRGGVVATDFVRALKIKTKNSGNQSHEDRDSTGGCLASHLRVVQKP